VLPHSSRAVTHRTFAPAASAVEGGPEMTSCRRPLRRVGRFAGPDPVLAGSGRPSRASRRRLLGRPCFLWLPLLLALAVPGFNPEQNDHNRENKDPSLTIVSVSSASVLSRPH